MAIATDIMGNPNVTDDRRSMPLAKRLETEEIENLPGRLENWFRDQLDDASNVKIKSLSRASEASGMSAQIFIVNLQWRTKGGNTEEKKYVVRAETTKAANPASNTVDMISALKILGSKTDLPIPMVYWSEYDPDHIGGPFFVMEYLEGIVAADSPPFTVEGWVKDATAGQRRKMYRSGLEFLAKFHELDWRALGLDFLLKSHGVKSQTEWCLDEAIRYYDEAVDGNRGEYETAAINWLRENRPARENLRLAWTDSRPANSLWKDFELVGALDWEMVTLMDPASDVAVWYFSDTAHTESLGLERLPGMCTREEFISIYEEYSGTRLLNYDYYEMLSAFKCHAIVANMVALWERKGQHFYGEGFDVQNNPIFLAFRGIAERAL